MQLADIYNELNTILPKKVVYDHWDEGKAPALPFLVYRTEGSNNFGADGIVYNRGTDVDVEFYTAKKDLTTEGKIEKALNNLGIYWECTEDYIESEKCFMVVYSFSI